MNFVKKTWYSTWFRILFILFGIWWQIPLVFWLGDKYNLDSKAIRNVIFTVYMGMFLLGCIYNNSSE